MKIIANYMKIKNAVGGLFGLLGSFSFLAFLTDGSFVFTIFFLQNNIYTII